MSKTKGGFGEDVLLLYPDDRSEKFHSFTPTHCGTPIVKGVVGQLRRWPSDLFFAFLVACLVIGCLVFLIFITIAFCLPSVVDNRCRVTENLEVEKSPNVYFLKLENRTWSTREFCYIESAAREHPNLSVYLINLSKDKLAEEMVDGKIQTGPKLLSSTNANDTLKLTPEEQLKLRLVSGSSNIQNIDITIDKFFKGSKLSKIVQHLNDETLEMAAKAQLLWNFPGIIVNPNMYCHLGSVERLVCNADKQNCLPDNLATVGPKNNIQATGVSCQAFMGFIIKEIANSNFYEEYTLQTAVERYCPRLYYCPEVRILSELSKCPTAELNCPIVYSSVILRDESNFGKTVT